MNQSGLGLLLLLIHIICCVLVYVAIRVGRLRVMPYLMPMVVFLPVWGVLCVLILHFKLWSRNRTHNMGMGRMQIQEAIYKSVLIENTDEDKKVVPFEEALLINVPELRRNLIMDMLNDNPREYMELLHRARMNEDVEVVHYATTAMAELSKEYDYRLQQIERAYSVNPQDEKKLEEYCNFLQEYINQGMVQGQMELMQRHQYSQLLKKRLEKKLSLQTCIQLVENSLKLEEYAQAWETLELIERNWPNREEGWMLRIRYFAQLKRGRELREVEQQIRDRNIYLSAESKEVLSFWQQNREKRETEA